MTFRRLALDRSRNTWMFFSIAFILCLPLLIGIALYIKSAPIFGISSLSELVFSSHWAPAESSFGFRPFISSSIYVTLLSFVFSIPVCLFSAIFLTEFASGQLVRIMRPVIDILAGLPSVIYGVWGVLIIVPLIGDIIAPIINTSSSGYCVLSGGIVLAIMCIPYIMNMLIEIFQTVPLELKEASMALGASRWEMIKHVVLRKSFSGIVSSYGLGLTKAFGETLAVMMVVGNSIQLSMNPLEPGYPLPALIANNYGEMLSIPMYDSALMFAALLLLVIILIINLFFRYLIHKIKKR